MNFKCLIIDDELPAIEVLAKYIQQTVSLELIGGSTNPLEAIGIIAEKEIDVIFLDIQMEELSGLELAKIIDPRVQVIFCTGFSEFAVDSYELNAVDYLLKPVSYNRFLKAVGKLRGFVFNPNLAPLEAADTKNDYIFVKTGNKSRMVKVNLNDILFIEASNNFIKIDFGHGEELAVNSTLKDIYVMISGDNFIRIHHSFIVSLNKIERIEKNVIWLQGKKHPVSIGNSYRNEFLKRIEGRVLKKSG